MLSREDLADIVKNKIEDKIRKGEISTYFSTYYYILLDGKMYPEDDYNEGVAKGILSANDIYAYVDIYGSINFDAFLLHIDYLEPSSAGDIVNAYLRKMGFTLEYYSVLSPVPNLKYFIDAGIKRDKDRKPEYLVVNVYDVDALARSFHIPQFVEQWLGNKPREIITDVLFHIYEIILNEQPLLAGYTYYEAYDILWDYYVDHKEKYKDEAYKITFAYTGQFPTPYRVCYKWGAGIFVEIDCLKLELRRFSS